MADGAGLRPGDNRAARLALGSQNGCESKAIQPGGKLGSTTKTDLTVLLDAIDSMAVDMLSDCRDDRSPEEGDGP